jgi:hypothetical protein
VKEKEAKLDVLSEPEVLGVDYWSGKGSAKRAFKKWNGVILFSLTWGIPTGREHTKIFQAGNAILLDKHPCTVQCTVDQKEAPHVYFAALLSYAI